MHEESGQESWGLRNTSKQERGLGSLLSAKEEQIRAFERRSAMRESLLEVWNVDIAQAFCKETGRSGRIRSLTRILGMLCEVRVQLFLSFAFSCTLHTC